METQAAPAKADSPLPIKGILLLLMVPAFLVWAVWLMVSTEANADVPKVQGPALVQAFEGWRGQVTAALKESDAQWEAVQELVRHQRPRLTILQASNEARKVHWQAIARLEALEGRSPSEMSENALRSMEKVREALIKGLQARSVFHTWLEMLAEGQYSNALDVAIKAKDADEAMRQALGQLETLTNSVKVQEASK
ncbi:MAG: hypothetical protein HYZ13_13570 [Acidobacteria bacterium]|nr:hypothetical protein [Acidobacteriota bacterium]